MKKIRLLCTIALLAAINCFSQDIRGGEMILSQDNSNSVDGHIYLYQQISTYINRPFLLVDWGDSSPLDTCTLAGPTTIAPNVYETIYWIPQHTYSGNGNYIVSVRDTFRIANIANISGSSSEELYLFTELSFNPFMYANSHDSPHFGHDQTVVLNNNGVYSFDPFAFSPEGDSLSYSLIPCFTHFYNFPPAASINSITGIFSMTPTAVGIYAIAIKIDEWRVANTSANPVWMGSTIRDMVIDVNSLASVNENILSQSDISVFPNPANDFVTIDLNNVTEKNLEIKIVDVLGQTVIEKKEENVSGNFEKQIDVSELKEGVYMVMVGVGDKEFSRKIIVQH